MNSRATVGRTMRWVWPMIAVLEIVAGCATTTAHRPATAGPATVLRARNPIEMARLYERRFESASRSQLEKWAAGDDIDHAIPAAWELVRRSVPPTDNQHPDRAALQRFVAVVERCTGTAPVAWKEAVLGAGSNNPHNIWFDAWGRAMTPLASLPQADGASAKPEGNRVSVAAVRAYHWDLPHQEGDWYDQSAVLFARDRAYVAFYLAWPAYPYTLYAVSPDSGSVLWSARVWAENGFLHATGGEGGGRVELTVRGRVLTVFGVSSGAAYVERFDTDTGKTLSRFCTKYFDTDFDILMTRGGAYWWETALEKGVTLE